MNTREKNSGGHLRVHARPLPNQTCGGAARPRNSPRETGRLNTVSEPFRPNCTVFAGGNERWMMRPTVIAVAFVIYLEARMFCKKTSPPRGINGTPTFVLQEVNRDFRHGNQRRWPPSPKVALLGPSPHHKKPIHVLSVRWRLARIRRQTKQGLLGGAGQELNPPN